MKLVLIPILTTISTSTDLLNVKHGNGRLRNTHITLSLLPINNVDHGRLLDLSSNTTESPSFTPTAETTVAPSRQLSKHPSSVLSHKPTKSPSSQPTKSIPSHKPSSLPTNNPTVQPSKKTKRPTNEPTVRPSNHPSHVPSHQPSKIPSTHPTTTPSTQPTPKSTSKPTVNPTIRPSRSPSSKISSSPSSAPSYSLSFLPSKAPWINHSVKPTTRQTSRDKVVTNSGGEKKKSFVNLIIGLCVGLGTPLMLWLLFFLVTNKRKDRHQPLYDIPSPNHRDPTISRQSSQPSRTNSRGDQSTLDGLSIPIPLSPESLESGTSLRLDLLPTESGPSPSYGGNPYLLKDRSMHLNVAPSASSEESLGFGLNISPNAIRDVRKVPQPAFSFSSGMQTFTPDVQSSDPSVLHQSGLVQMDYSDYIIFECSVPAGPLGIVVDSTPEGPVIHSIKSSSHFIYTLRPGDLIVGLDGINTRGLSAPSLTRLMAKKIQQPERILTIMRHK